MRDTRVLCDICDREVDSPFITIRDDWVNDIIPPGRIRNLPHEVCRSCFEKAFGIKLKVLQTG